MKIRNVKYSDAVRIAEIYNYYIENTVITFEIKKVTAADIKKRIAKHSVDSPWITGEVDGKVIGYAYIGTFREREAYRFTKELSVYFDKAYTGKGYGKILFKALLAKTKKTKTKVLIGSIALPNEASVKLHENAGFKKAAHLAKVGYKFKKRIDVGYWELILK